MSFANPLSRLSAIIRAPVMVHTASSTESDWFLPYDGPIEPAPPAPTRHPFAAELPQPKAVPASARTRSKSKSESHERIPREHSRSRSRDAKRKSQRSYVALDTGGGVGAYPAPERDREHRDRDRERSSVQSDFTFGAHSAHTMGANSAHTRGPGSLPLPGSIDLGYTFPPTDDSTVSTGKTSDPPLVFASHPFRMHTGSPPPRSHTASASLSTPWVRTIASSPVPDPAPVRKRTLTYQPGLVSSFGSAAETRVGYRESGAFLDLDAREREKIRPTLLPPSLSLLGKPSGEQDGSVVDEHGAVVHKSVSSDSNLGLRGQYDMRSHPYAATSGPVRETRFGSVSTTTTTTTGGTGKPPVPPRPIGLKLKSSLKPSMSTPELRVHIPTSAPAAILRQVSNNELSLPAGVGARIPRSAGAVPGSVAAPTSASAGTTGLEVRTICDALIFARPRFKAHEITPPPSPGEDDEDAAKRASVVVGEGGLKGLACFPRARIHSDGRTSTKEKEQEQERPDEAKFKTVAEVLRDRDQLEKDREEWNALGQSSLLNNRTRSLSRSQSRIGGARVGGSRPRRETVGGNGESGWGTLKLKRSVEMLAATALSQGHGHAPSVSVSSSHRRVATQGSISVTSHARGASGSVVSRAHSRADSWGQRVVCGSRSASSLGDDLNGGHTVQSSEGVLRGARRPVVEDYPVIDIRPIPTGDTHRARAPPPPPPVSAGFGVAGSSGRPAQQRLSPGPNHAMLHPAQPPPSPGDSTIGLALSSPGGAALVLSNHPFSNRAGAHPAIEAPVPIGPETIATRHRHPPRSSGSTERARLDEPNHILRPSKSAPPVPSTKDLPPLQMKFPSSGPSKSSTSSEPQHPFVTRPVMLSTASGEVQRMFENAMLKSVVSSSAREWDRRRGSGDSGLGSSVNDHGVEMHRVGGRKVSGSSALAGASMRGSAFGPPSELEEVGDAPVDEEPEEEREQEPSAPAESELQPPVESEKAVSPMGSAQSPFSLLDSLSPASRRGVLTRVSSGMVDPALAGTTVSPMLSHESSSSSFSSPKPLASIDDIESLRGIFYRPSPVRNLSRLPSSQEGSPPDEPNLEEAMASDNEEYGREIIEGYHDQEDWTFGRPIASQYGEPQPLWERRQETNQQSDKTPLRIDLAPGTPSPTSATSPLPPAPVVASPIVPRSAVESSHSHSYQDVPESIHDSDTQSERSVFTTSSQRATNENLTFGFVRSAQVDLLGVNDASRPHSTALSLIDMYDYDASVASSSPNTPLNHPAFPSPFTHTPQDGGFLSPASAGIHRPGMDRPISDFPTTPADGTPMSSAVLSTYFGVDNHTSSRRSADERSC